MDELTTYVLNWVNEWRIARELEVLEDLRKGLRGNAGYCPIANSLTDSCSCEEHAYVGGGTALIISTSPDRRELPTEVKTWTSKFDNPQACGYPQYIGVYYPDDND